MSTVKMTDLPVFMDIKSLASYLEMFIGKYETAVQLDGSLSKTSNPNAVLYFRDTSTGKFFQLNGDTRREAIERFIQIIASHGENCLVINPESESRSRFSLLIVGSEKPDGWFCYEFKYLPISRSKAA